MTKQFWKAAGVRALRTMAQAAIVMIPTGIVVSDVNWGMVAGIVATEGILSVLTSIAMGLPEVPFPGEADETADLGRALDE